jgi:ATP-dependent DNA helicase DinG
MIPKLDIDTQIQLAYKKLGYTVRGNQAEIIFSVVDAFLNKGKKNVILGAPTGVGKSIIGAVISECVNALTPEKSDLASIIAMGTNSLAVQYAESFDSLGEYDYFRIMGASNYPCRYMAAQPSATSVTADDCAYSKMHETEQQKYCGGCEYKHAKKMVNATSNLITNYTYFMISALASDHLKKRKLHIFDEAHTLNDWFCSYAEIVVSVELIDKYIKELGDVNGKCDNEIAGLIMLKQKVSSAEIGENNYDQCLKILLSIYVSIASTLGAQSEMLKGEDVVRSVKYAKMARKYTSIGSKISDMFDNDYEHVFDNTVPNTFTVKTIFVGKMMAPLLTDYNLFMSATITEQYAFEILELDKGETEIIQLDSVFPPENKPLFFIGKQALNYNTLKDPDTITTLKTQIRKVVEFYGEEKGLILVPSFYLGNQLSFGVRYTKVFEHKAGVNLSELISEFKKYKGSAVLVSPSIYEGLDFANDSARFQILVKSPYPSLGDKRIKYIADNYPKIYQEMTLLKIIQGTGRGVRHPEDYCSTFFLDQSSKKIFDSKLNIWKDHFDIKSN